MRVHPPTSSHQVLLECGARPTDRGWYTHTSTWPTAAASEGSGDLWANVAADGRLRVFQAARPTSRSLLHSTPVLGPVLSLQLWPEKHVVVTLEESPDPKRTRYSRIIRFYSYGPQAKEREVLELSAVELDQSPHTPIFSPSLFSLCPHSHILALCHDQLMKFYDLNDIFYDESKSQPLIGTKLQHQLAEEFEPGGAQTTTRQHEAKLSLTHPSPSRAIAATFPNTRRYHVKVYQILPMITILSPYTIRHFDYKQSYLTYSSYNECRVLCLRLEQNRVGYEHEREQIEYERARLESTMPTTQSLAGYPSLSIPKPPLSRQASSVSSQHQRTSSQIPIAPFELIGTRSLDSELKLNLREDIFIRELVVVLHRRFNATDQIHTVRFIPPLTPRSPPSSNTSSLPRAQSSQDSTSSIITIPSATLQRRTSATQIGSPILKPISPPLPSSNSFFITPPTVKQELFSLLGNGLPTHPFSVPFSLDSISGSPSGHSSFVPSTSFEHSSGVVIELMDDENESSTTQTTLQLLLHRLEVLEDENEASKPAANSTTDQLKGGEHGHELTTRSNGHIYLPMRLLISTSEQCHLYDVEADVKLVTYYFEHDLISLQVRSSFLFALTTNGLEVHSLWFGHPMLNYLTLPLLIQRASDEPGAALKEKISDMIVLDHSILLRPAPISYSSANSSGGTDDFMISGSPSTHLIVPTDDMDPCESWPTIPIKPIPTVLDVVKQTIEPLAIKSMQSSKEATPSSIRLFTEALLLLIQRYSQLRVLVEYDSEGDNILSRTKLRHEFLGVSSTLSSINSYLAQLFLSVHEFGLSCYFYYYQTDSALEPTWNKLSQEINALSASSSATSNTGSNNSSSKYLTKFLMKILLNPSPQEKEILLASPNLIASFITHIGLYAPHVLGRILLTTFLLHCPYDPKQILKILEENSARGNFDSSNNGTGGGPTTSSQSRQSRVQSSAGTPTAHSSMATHGGQVPYRVRPVVFHTFVQSLMHLQLSATVSGSSGKDSASILLNSFSVHSLEYLLITYSTLLTSWSFRTVLVDFLRASVPWSLLEVLIVLTQRGQIHVQTGVTLLLGPQAASSIASPNGAVSSSFSFTPSLPVSQLQAYLECSLNPFMLTQEIGHVLQESHGHSIEPFDTTADVESYLAHASSLQLDPSNLDIPDPNGKFVPLHIRENHKYNPNQIVVAQPADVQSITRSQIAALVTQLACFYLQQEISELTHPSTSPSNRNSVSSTNIPSPSLTSVRRTVSMSMSMSLAPAAEFAAKHALSNWWRGGWIQTLRHQIPAHDSNMEESSSMARISRLQSLLSSPLPLGREHYQQIFSLLKHLPNDAPEATPTKLSLMLLTLPRVGDLSTALRLVVSHSPECMLPFASVYCGDINTSTPQTHAFMLHHWQLLHAILLIHILHSHHTINLGTPKVPPLDGEGSLNAARVLLQSLLRTELVDSLLLPLPASVSDASCNYLNSMSSMVPIERAALYQQLYTFLLDQLVMRHGPSEFLTFIPAVGSSKFYLPYVQLNFTSHQRQKQQPEDRSPPPTSPSIEQQAIRLQQVIALE